METSRLIGPIKKFIGDVRSGREGTPSSYFGSAAYCLFCLVVGSVGIVYGKFDTEFWQGIRRLGVFIIAVDVLIMGFFFSMGFIALRGKRAREVIVTIRTQ